MNVDITEALPKIPMKRWLVISQRYGITPADLGDFKSIMTELLIVVGNEILRATDGKEHWDELEEMPMLELANLINGAKEGPVDDATKSGE